jgi:hypothetical protein
MIKRILSRIFRIAAVTAAICILTVSLGALAVVAQPKHGAAVTPLYGCDGPAKFADYN